jgi:hypothetical protein
MTQTQEQKIETLKKHIQQLKNDGFKVIADCESLALEDWDGAPLPGFVKRKMEQAKREERERILAIISRGKATLDEWGADGYSSKFIEAKRDVLGWLKQEIGETGDRTVTRL